MKSSGLCLSLVAAFILLTGIQGKAQGVNFSGTWTFNESKSPASEGGFRFAPSKLVITQSGNDLTVQRTSPGMDGGEMTTTDKFTLDGKECINTMFGDNKRKTVVKWSADSKSLIFSHSMSFEMDGQSMQFNSTENWKLNEADKTLSVETLMTTPNGEMKTTNVYDRK
ncbi:MAG: hypothetical protein GYA43_12095 [Bacteroidales bacterium]|nr:hypothetical protein [Bacteroidales bacterium]